MTLSLTTLLGQSLTSHYGTVKNNYNFWFYEPEEHPHPTAICARRPLLPCPITLNNDSTADWSVEIVPPGSKPLVIFLHGASLCGRDLQRVKTYGTLDALAKGLKLDAYVLAPQNPGGSWSPKLIGELIDWCQTRYNVDTTRIYVLGMSLGGYGTIDVSAAFPKRIAAAFALCGGGTSKQLANLNDVPLFIAHGTADRAVACAESQRVVDVMAQTRGNRPSRLIWMKLPGRTHGDLARYLYLQDTYRWLFSHCTSDSLRPISRDYDFSFDRLKGVYQPLKAGQTPIKYHAKAKDPGPRFNLPLDQSLLAQSDNKKADKEVVEEQANAPQPQVNESQQYYHVRKGDTLYSIAKRYNTSVEKICKLNGISEKTTLKIGKSIRIK